jgi:hypothetical protein
MPRYICNSCLWSSDKELQWCPICGNIPMLEEAPNKFILMHRDSYGWAAHSIYDTLEEAQVKYDELVSPENRSDWYIRKDL